MNQYYYQTSLKSKRSIYSYIFGKWLYFFTKLLIIIFSAYKKINNNKTDIKNIFIYSSISTLKAIENCGGKIFISGVNNLKKIQGPVIFVSNHMNILDVFLLPFALFDIKKSIFIVKQELLSVPIFGSIVRGSNQIIIDRVSPKENYIHMINESINRIKLNNSIIVFPQGTRTVNFDKTQFNTIGIKLARKLKLPVIPIALKTNFLEKIKYIKKIPTINIYNKIHIEIGSPLYIIDNRDIYYNNKIIDFIMKKLFEWDNL